MVAALVLLAGVLFVIVVGTIVLVSLNMTALLPSLVPLSAGLVMIGTFLLIITELILLLGKSERRDALRDLSYLLPTFLVSTALWYVAQFYLWR